MRWILSFVALVSSPILAQALTDDIPSWQVPDQVKACITSFGPLAKSSLILNLAINPYYLRGDFDGDGRTDLAIALRSRLDDSKLGTGICRSGQPPVLLGAIGKGPPFSDDPADNIASVGWSVVDRQRVMQILSKHNAARHARSGIRVRLAGVKGEMIFMPYEDAEGLIYYYGGRFRWYTINSTMLPQTGEGKPPEDRAIRK